MSDGPPPGGSAGASILVVDDRRANLVAMEALLTPLGRPVVVAESGEDALRRVLAEDFAVILLDVQMPGMDGFETARFIRERPRSRHVPIIFVTAISAEADRVFDGYRVGAVDYILKPVNPDLLRAKVRVFLDLHDANARLRRQESMRAAHESLALAQRAGMSGIWDWDIVAGRMFCSPEYEELCGLPPTRPDVQTAWLDVVHPAERGDLTRRLDALLDGGDEWDEEYRIVHAERGIRWIAARGRVYRGPGGEAQRFTGIAFDVTERKQAEARAGRLHEATAALSAAASADAVAKLVLLHAPAAAGARAATLWLAGDEQPPPAMPAEAVDHAREALRAGPAVVPVDGGRLTLLALSAGEGPSGVLCLDYGRRPPPDSEAQAFLAGLGAHCAQALERARLYDLERRARERARFSADVSMTLDAAGLGVQSRLDRLADLLVPRLADVCVIALEGDDGELETVAARAGRRDAESAPSSQEAAEDVLDTGEPRLAADGATLVVPISAHGRVLGTLTLVSVDPARRFDEDDFGMATDIGRRAGLAVQNARLFEEQATVALTLQKSLLPRELPVVEGISWAARYLPKAAGTEAGGDWFAAVPSGDGRVMVAVGDVVGRGTGAAAVMGQLRSAARAYATAGMAPGAILGHLSRLAENIPGAFASTAACVEIDPAGQTLRYARAGHPPPLLIASDGRAELLPEAHGTVLGIRHDEREEVVVPMPTGSALVLYTDGAVERRGEQLDTGLDRLARTAAACWPAAPATLCDDLVARLFTAEGPADDVALLVTRTGLPDPLALRAPARLDELSGMRAGVREWLRTVPLAPVEREDVLLACGEALANCVEHGAGRSDGMMWVDAAWDADGVMRVRVRDDGPWREQEPDPLGLRGRGFTLMRRIMDEVEVHAGDGHTEVVMRLRPESPSTVLVGVAAGSQAAAVRPVQPADIEVLALDGMRMVRLSGEIDAAAAPALRAEFETLLLVGGAVTVDTGQVDYLDSAGVALLWDFEATLAGQGREMQLIAPEGSRVRRVLELTRPAGVEILEAARPAEAPADPSPHPH